MHADESRLPDKSMMSQVRSSKTDLTAIKVYMDQHFNEPLSIAQLAQMANISSNYFVDLFKKTYGLSAVDYLTTLRINRAKRYLSESDRLLRDIALKVGYSNEFYFSRKFKKEVGVSPSEFVKNPRQRIAAFSPSIMGHMLALDVMPAAAPLNPKWTASYFNAYRTQIKNHLEFSGPRIGSKFAGNLEKLTLTRPDAIIATDELCPEEQTRLMNIAPCLFVQTATLDWRDQLRSIARFLDKEDKAEQWIHKYESKARSASGQIEEALGGETVLVLRIQGQNIHAFCNPGIADVLYRDLKLAAAYRSEPCYVPVTPKQLLEIRPDRILVMVCQEAPSWAYWLAIQSSQVWRQLKAVRKGHVCRIPSDPWFEYSAVAVNRILDEVLLLFTGQGPDASLDTVLLS